VDTPIFLAGLLAGPAAKYAQLRCICAREHGGTGRYMFYSPEGTALKFSDLCLLSAGLTGRS
jgi:hypothetical protein